MARLSRDALSSVQLRLSYSSNFIAGGRRPHPITENSQFATLSHSSRIPSTSTVAVTFCPLICDVSTIICVVSCPLAISPSDKDHLYFKFVCGLPPEMFRDKVVGVPGHTTSVGQLIFKDGHEGV